MPKANDICSTREAARRLGVSLRTAQMWVDSGVLQAWKTQGGHRRVSIASVERLLAERGREVAPPPPAPISRPAETVSSSPTAHPAAAERLVVLVAEDNPMMMRIYRAAILAWGLPIELYTASNGYEALVLVGRARPDLMITDLMMPGVDGFEMIRVLSASPFREGMGIIVVTGLDDAEIVQRGGLPEGIPVLHKPVRLGMLRDIAESWITRRDELIRT